VICFLRNFPLLHALRTVYLITTYPCFLRWPGLFRLPAEFGRYMAEADLAPCVIPAYYRLPFSSPITGACYPVPLVQRFAINGGIYLCIQRLRLVAFLFCLFVRGVLPGILGCGA